VKKDSGKNNYLSSNDLPDFPLWEKVRSKRGLLSFDLEITARCNNNCRHCYINLPASNKAAQRRELTFSQIKCIVDEAVSLGAIWCLITGGEPLLREDFTDIYLYLKKKGVLVSVFTNATLLTEEHVQLFRKYPPRDIEVTVYGVTQETYEQVSRVPGSFEKFMKGLDLLLENEIRVRFKAMALKSNVHELNEISRFCRARTKDYFRFDPLLHLRFDGDKEKNEDIISERLSPQEIVSVERGDPERFQALGNACDKLIVPKYGHLHSDRLFHCGAGNGSFSVSYDGLFRLCSSLWREDCIYDLKSGSLAEAYNHFVPRVRDKRSDRKEFLEKCSQCPIINLCLWCPAHSHLETGQLDTPVDYFCKVAYARQDMLGDQKLLPIHSADDISKRGEA
jgi:radical SAM protein with 4Fe4S-binding SPASM domain